MRYVILRDDDTNALTPIECLDRLYQPLIERGAPVNLALIPAVTSEAHTAEGKPEEFLFNRNGHTGPTFPIASNPPLIRYLLENKSYRIVQHGFHHDYLEFETHPAEEIARRLDEGTRLLLEAGFPRPETFVAPYDKFSRSSYREVASRFSVISTGWFERERLPASWWPRYVLTKASHTPHWRIGNTVLLSHPGCLLSCFRSYDTILGEIIRVVNSQRLTVLVTHWWEYFRGGKPDNAFIAILHETIDYLVKNPEIKIISFADLPTGKIPLN
jgi:hypothetical protein